MHADLAALKLKVSLAVETVDAEIAESKAKGEKTLAMEKTAQSDAHRFRELVV